MFLHLNWKQLKPSSPLFWATHLDLEHAVTSGLFGRRGFMGVQTSRVCKHFAPGSWWRKFSPRSNNRSQDPCCLAATLHCSVNPLWHVLCKQARQRAEDSSVTCQVFMFVCVCVCVSFKYVLLCKDGILFSRDLTFYWSESYFCIFLWYLCVFYPQCFLETRVEAQFLLSAFQTWTWRPTGLGGRSFWCSLSELGGSSRSWTSCRLQPGASWRMKLCDQWPQERCETLQWLCCWWMFQPLAQVWSCNCFVIAWFECWLELSFNERKPKAQTETMMKTFGLRTPITHRKFMRVRHAASQFWFCFCSLLLRCSYSIGPLAQWTASGGRQARLQGQEGSASDHIRSTSLKADQLLEFMVSMTQPVAAEYSWVYFLASIGQQASSCISWMRPRLTSAWAAVPCRHGRVEE